jgi:hypothetical protein
MSDTQNSLSNIQQLAPQEMTVPTDLVPLPSGGRVYPLGSPLAGKDSVEIKSMTAKDEDILTSRALIRSGKVITSLLRSCLLDRTIDPDKMLVGDRNAAIIGIRITGYGAEYPIKVECPQCNSEVKKEINLTDLPIRNFPEDLQVTTGKNEFTFSLPVSKKTAVFKLLTGEEERELLQLIDRGRKATGGEELVTTRLKMQVVEISGERDPQKLASIIRNLPARDSRELRKYIEKITPGVEMKTQFTCESCSYQGEVEVPLGTDFFWPEA